VIHGGPGAPGSVGPVARELSKFAGVLEPFQTEKTLDGQIVELKDVLEKDATLPAILIGHSWGAWLAYFVAGRYPSMVKKLILVGSGPFEQKYVDNIFPERLSRLSPEDRIEVLGLIDAVNYGAAGNKDESMGRLGKLFAKADTYEAVPLDGEPEPMPVSEEVSRKVWAEAEHLRVSGEILMLGANIECPVVAIHGDYDPHPADGVRKPLQLMLADFRFILLRKCGHEPWIERYAREEFFKTLEREII